MKNTFIFAFFIGSARPPEMIQSSPVGTCASTNSIPNTFVDCSARPPFEEILWNHNRIHNYKISTSFVLHMAKKVIDVIIDGNTGKISIHVDGYPIEECTQLAKKLAGNNILIPTKGDVGKGDFSTDKTLASKEEAAQREAVKHE